MHTDVKQGRAVLNRNKPVVSKAALLLSAVLFGASGYWNCSDANAAQPAAVRADMETTRSTLQVVEQRLRTYDDRIAAAQLKVRTERDQSYKYLHNAKREVKRQQFEIERIQQSIALIDKQVDLIQTEKRRSIERYESLNSIKRGLEASTHQAALAENDQKISALEISKRPYKQRLQQAQEKLQGLSEQMSQDADELTNLDSHPEVLALTQQRDKDQAQVASLRKQLASQKAALAAAEQSARQAQRVVEVKKPVPKPQPVVAKAPAPTLPLTFDEAPAAGNATGSSTYVFAISGEAEKNIEHVLNLKPWVESYGGHYIESKWNGFSGSARQDTDQFRFEFAQKLRDIPANARIVIIGHGLGGGAAIEAATEVAYTNGRNVDLLAVLDPVGQGALRANIVNKSSECAGLDLNAKDSVNSYMSCLSSARPRLITNNVKNFYNRWQKESGGALDVVAAVEAKDVKSGETREIPTATGRFGTSTATSADQMRVFFGNEPQAHLALLKEEAKKLPNLLVKYMR